MFRKALALLSGNFASSIILLARNLILARFLTVENYGIAATFAIAMATVEMVTDFGLRQLIVQSDKSDDPKFQNGLQGLQIMRGCIAAVLLFLIAAPMSQYLRIEEAVNGYRLLAVVPFINGFVHLDVFRFNRSMRFAASIVCQVLPALVSFLVVILVAPQTGSWLVLLWAIIIQSLLTVVLSLFLAERPFRPKLDRSVISGSFAFGWPVFLNGILMLVLFQADRIAVGRILSVEDLATFSVLMMLTLTPAIIADRTLQSFFLPQLANATDRFPEVARVYFGFLTYAGLSLISLVLLVGPFLLGLVVGPKYDAVLSLLAIGALSQVIRLLRTGPAIMALSQGNTRNSLYGNAVRVVAMPIGWWMLQVGYGIADLLYFAVVTESVALALVCLILPKRNEIFGLQVFVEFAILSQAGMLLGNVAWAAVMLWVIWRLYRLAPSLVDLSAER